MKIFNCHNKTELQNKLLNSILKIIFLENNQNICDLLFNNSSIFNKPDDYRHIISLSYSKILIKFSNMRENESFRKIMTNILSRFTYNEMQNCLTDLNKNFFSNYKSLNYFYILLIEIFPKVKSLEYYINEQIYEIIQKIFDIKKYEKEKLLKNDDFKEIIFKSFFILLNTVGKYNPKNYYDIFNQIKKFLDLINEETFLIEIFKIFFIEFYFVDKSQNENNEIILKYQFLNNCGDCENFINLKLRELDSTLFSFLENIIELFSSFTTPDIQIIYYFNNYFNLAFYSFYQIFLIEFNSLRNNKIKSYENDFLLCNFFHIYQSKKIYYNYYYFLIKYAKNNNNSNVFKIFPELKASLMNIFNLCPHPFFLDIIIDMLNDIEKTKENQTFFKEIFEMILEIELIGGNNVYKMDDLNENKYSNYFFNTIILLKIFYYFSKDAKASQIFNDYEIKLNIFKFFIKLKKNLFIYSHNLFNLEKKDIPIFKKTILEMCFTIVISIFNNSQENNLLNSEFYKLFLDENIENDNTKTNGKSIIFIFDNLNILLFNKNKKLDNIKNENYINIDFEHYLDKIKHYRKEEKSLIIIFILLIKNNNIDNNFNNDNNIDKLLNLLLDDLIILINNSATFKKTKSDIIYDSFIDMINSLKKNNNLKKQNILLMIEEIILKNKNNKKIKPIEEINYISLLNKDKNNDGTCLLQNKCSLLKKNYCETFEDLGAFYYVLNSYFDIEMLNVVKCLKKDLLLKDCSIYFNDIYYNDNNFKKIKNSFYYNYKKYLPNNDDNYNIELLSYPSRLKNFSSSKYFTPKIFLSSYTNFYVGNKNFELFYPKIKKNLIKNKTFPPLPSHYEYYKNLLQNNDDNLILSTLNCELISIKQIIFGTIDIYEKFILFKNKDEFEDYQTSIKFIYSTGISDISLNKKIIIINYKEIEEIIKRTFVYNSQAIEIFLKNGKSYLFNLFEEFYLYHFYDIMQEHIIKNKENFDFIITKEPKLTFEKNGYTRQWENNEITNYQYLLYINKYSGRTFNDINQYPIFPWMFLTSIYHSLTKKNNDDNNDNENENENTKIFFRNMNYFMMTQTEEGRECAIQNYKDLEKENPNKGYHFALHYSTCGFILLYLMRISPFMDTHIHFQSGKFDNPNRLISNIDELLNIMYNCKENRELIPEFFTSIEYFYNLNYIFFGIRSLSPLNLVNNLNSCLFNSFEKYIYYNRLFLNNRSNDKNKGFPKCKIYNWINLIFGSRQFPVALNSLNKFEKYTYRQNVSLTRSYDKYKNKNYTKDQAIKSIQSKKSRILNFGQCPEQLFYSKHNHYKIDLSNPIIHQLSKIFEAPDKNIKIITFWLSENQSYIYFLAKNKERKNMSVFVYDEKYNKKCEICIDKIKLFNCANFFNKKELEKEQKSDEIKDNRTSFKLLEKLNTFRKFVLIEEEDKEYVINNLSDLYILSPRYAIIDINDYLNTYFFIARNKDNTIKIYEEQKNSGRCIGFLKTDSFSSVIFKKDSESFFTGHQNGKLIEWNITYKEIVIRQNMKLIPLKNRQTKIIFDNIIFKREIFAHSYCMIASIYYSEKHNIILTSDIGGFLFIRKYYDFEFLTKIKINNDDCFFNKIFINDYDNICTINFDSFKFKTYICLYSLNGILLEKTNLNYCIDSYALKNGKIIFNCLNNINLLIFGFNGNKNKETKIGEITEENILKTLDVKRDQSDIMNFIIDNNYIYLYLKNGKFVKGYLNKLDSLSFGLNLNKQNKFV